MQRKLKFRAWDGHTMFPVNVLAIAPVTWMCAEGRGVSLAWQPHVKVMQYTGLKDNKGVEIYEGDILNYDNGIGVIGTVIWHGDGFAMKVLGAGMASNKTLYNSLEDIEIIGNIYANPDLLKEGE